MDREVLFCGDKICDDCGVKGAFDFMGDYYCADCMKKFDCQDDEPIMKCAKTNDLIGGINIRLIFPENVSEQLLNILREQDVECSDWDYIMIFEDVDLFIPVYDNYYANRVEPKEYYIEKLLTGCCDNVFFHIWIDDSEFVVGVAYHG